MNLKLISGPTQKPVTLAEAKSHLRVVQDNEDALIESLIVAAREWCEDFQNKSYLTQTWKLTFDELQFGTIEIPKPPLQSIDNIVLVETDGTENSVTDYEVDDNSTPGRLLINSYPDVEMQKMSGLQITFTAGHQTADDVPEKVKSAIKLLVGHWYKNREAVIKGSVPRPLKMAVKSLLSQDRVVPI